MHQIKRIFLQNFKKILQHEKSDTKHIFTSPPLLAYKRDTNLKQLLIRSSLNLKPNGTHPCGHSLCCTCEHTNPSDAISGPKNTFHIQHHFTCSYVCVIYSITCTKCSTLYIGETCHQLNTRFRLDQIYLRFSSPYIRITLTPYTPLPYLDFILHLYVFTPYSHHHFIAATIY